MKRGFGSLVTEMELSEFLTPTDWIDSGGLVETASAQARIACETIGKLLALLAEKKVLTLKECCQIAEKDRSDIAGEVL